MTITTITLYNRFTREPIYTLSCHDNTHRMTVESAIERGISLLSLNLSNMDLDGIDLSNQVLKGVSFAYSSLRGANLPHANCELASFRGADLTNANLEGTNLAHATLTEAITKHALLAYAHFYSADVPIDVLDMAIYQTGMSKALFGSTNYC